MAGHGHKIPRGRDSFRKVGFSELQDQRVNLSSVGKFLSEQDCGQRVQGSYPIGVFG